MNSELLEQRKAAYQYNQERNHLMSALCEPLKTYLGIDFFYRGTFSLNFQQECEGHRLLTTNDKFPALIFKFNDNGKSYTQAIKETPLNASSYFLWPEMGDCCLRRMAYEEYGLLKGISVYKRIEDQVEVWAFASTGMNGIPNVITQTSVSPFQDFIYYFEEKQNSANLFSPFVNYSRPFDMSYNGFNLNQIELFKSAVNSKTFTLKINNRLAYLSKREWECLSKFAMGKTYKGIANILSLSPRTVESYLNQIKEKTGISSKAKLIDHFIEQNQSFFR